MSDSSKAPAPQTKKFGKGDRKVPHHSDKAPKYYPVEDAPKPKTVRKTIRPTNLRKSLQPGTVLILLAGRFRGKRVILLKPLDQGVLLVTGPFKVNGVPLRRVNARYVIATSTQVDIKSLDKKLLDKVSSDEYFARDKAKDKKSEEAFFKQGEAQKKELSKGRADDQKAIDKAILAKVKKEPMLESYLAASFSLRKGDRPHEMVF